MMSHRVSKEDFEGIKNIIYRSLGLTSLNLTFLVAYYKIGFFAALASIAAFTFPNVLFMYLISLSAHNINKVAM